MNKKVFLIAGHSRRDPGAIANGYKEADLTMQLRNQISVELKRLNVPHEIDDDALTTAQVVRAIKSRADDLILDIHFNAAAPPQPGKPMATGVEAFIPDHPTSLERMIARQLTATVAQTLGIANRGVKLPAQSARGKLGIMQPAGTNVLLEVMFLTNPADIQAYLPKMPMLATAIASLIKEQFHD